MFDVYTFGPLRVLVDSATGAIVAVQDTLTGCAASLLYSRRSIAEAMVRAHQAWQSTAELA